MGKYYLFYVREDLPREGAHLVQIIHLANAAANLDYPVLLAYHQSDRFSLPSPRPADLALKTYYSLQDKLKTIPLSLPWPIDRVNSPLLNSNTIVCKYYFPVHLKPQTSLVHSRDWNFVKAAVRHGIPAIYERDHFETKTYEPEIVNNPLFRVTVTVADTVAENLIANGMPPEKVIKLHNGFNQAFFHRQTDSARQWRAKLLEKESQSLVVYAGELRRFKGIDLLLEVAQALPDVQFALAGGPDSQIQAYQTILHEREIVNVKLVGYLPHNQLAGLLQAANVLVYPHLSGEAASFTSPMKLFDYIAAGKPILSTKIPPLQEFYASPLIAGWCEPDNPIEFRHSLERILSRYPNWSPEHLHSNEQVQGFSWESRVERIFDYIRQQYGVEHRLSRSFG